MAKGVCAVALLAEGVDRNFILEPHSPQYLVALLAEGVDRNFLDLHAVIDAQNGRPPRGGRG